jgi:hypothetical protein
MKTFVLEIFEQDLTPPKKEKDDKKSAETMKARFVGHT